jgi:hypothetical protein
MASNDGSNDVNIRGHVQAFLLNSIDHLTRAVEVENTRKFKKIAEDKAKQKGKSDYRAVARERYQRTIDRGVFSKHLVHTKFKESELVAQFNKTSGIGAYFNALPAQLSGLVPKIRIFLRQGRDKSGKLQPDIPVYFSGYTSANYDASGRLVVAGGTDSKSLDMFSERAKGRDVGITSFSVTIDNKFKFKSVQASMEIYFRNMADLSQGPYLHIIKLMNKKGEAYTQAKTKADKDKAKADALLAKIEAMRAQLVPDDRNIYKVGPATAAKPKSGKVDPAPLKAVIGWAANKNAPELPKDLTGGVPTDVLNTFLETTPLTLLLNVSKYSIEFGDQGEVKLKVEMTGYADDVMAGSLSANIFSNPWKVQRTTPHVNVRDRTGSPLAVSDQPMKKLVSVADVFGTPIDKIDLADLPRGSQANSGYLQGILQRKLTKLDGTTADVKARAKVEIDTEVIKTLIDLTEAEIELEKMHNKRKKKHSPKAKVGKKQERLEETLNKFKDIYSVLVTVVRGTVHRNFLERLEATGGIRTFDVNPKFLGLSFGKDVDEEGNVIGATAEASGRIGSLDNVGKTSIGSPQVYQGRVSAKAYAAASIGDKQTREKYIKNNKVGSGLPFTLPNRNNQVVSVTFVRLGDILDTAFHSSGFFTHNLKRKEGVFRIVLDSVTIKLKGGKKEVSLGDLPIQLSAFEYFFFDKYVKKAASNVPLRAFIKDLMDFVATEVTNAKLVGGTEGSTLMRFEPVVVPFNACNVNGRPLQPNKLYTPASVEFNTNTTTPRGFSVKREAEVKTNMESVNTYLLVGLAQTPESPGDRKKDVGRGVYHLVLASGRGPVKGIKFSELDVSEHIRTMNVRDGSADFPTVPQNATVDLIGSPHFWQGQLVYIDADYAMEGASTIMGIGGYYMITKVTHDLDLGDFKTTLECRWQSFKVPQPKNPQKRKSN